MNSLIVVIVFVLYLACFFGIGWNFYLLGKLWGTSEHVGKTSNGALIKLALSGGLLFLAYGIADWGGIPREAFKAPWLLIAAIFFLVVGGCLHWWLRRGESKASSN